MLARLQRLPDQLIVLHSRRRDSDAFYPRVGHDFRNAGGCLHTVLFANSMEHQWTYITHATQGAQVMKRAHNVLAPVTTTDDSDIWTDHWLFLPLGIHGNIIKETGDGIYDHLLLLFCKLRVVRKRQHFTSRSFRMRQAAFFVAEIRKCGLEVQWIRIVDLGGDAFALQVLT